MNRRSLCLSAALAHALLPLACGEGGGSKTKGIGLQTRTLEDRNYDASTDSFYRKKQIYATWIMLWNGSTETHGWKPEDYNCCKVLVEGRWQSINWDRDHAAQRWNVLKRDGRFRIVNKANDQALDYSEGRVVTKSGDPADESQLWSLIEIYTVPR